MKPKNEKERPMNPTGYVLVTYTAGDTTGQYNRRGDFYPDRAQAQAAGQKMAAGAPEPIGYEVLPLGPAIAEPYILYTYQTVNNAPVCEAYGPATEEEARFAGENLQKSAAAAGEPPLTFMVLPIESMPV